MKQLLENDGKADEDMGLLRVCCCDDWWLLAYKTKKGRFIIWNVSCESAHLINVKLFMLGNWLIYATFHNLMMKQCSLPSSSFTIKIKIKLDDFGDESVFGCLSCLSPYSWKLLTQPLLVSCLFLSLRINFLMKNHEKHHFRSWLYFVFCQTSFTLLSLI